MRHQQPYPCRNEKPGCRRRNSAKDVPEDRQVSVFQYNTPSERPIDHGIIRKPQSAAIVPMAPRIFAPTQTAMPTMFGPA
jgi:hypothetical protein